MTERSLSTRCGCGHGHDPDGNVYTFVPRAPAVKSKRARKQSEGDITTHVMRLRAVSRDPAVYLMSRAVPQRAPRSPGAPGKYPHWAYTVLNALIGPEGALRQACASLQDPDVWQWFVDGAREHLGQEAVVGVPATGPKRHHWYQWAPTYGTVFLAPLGQAFRDLALAQAARQGLVDTGADGTTARPHRTTMVVGDGKVMNAPCRNRTGVRVDPDTGEVIGTQRTDTASDDYVEGDGTKVYGSKFVALSLRDDAYYSRVVVDLEHLPPKTGEGGEQGLAVKMLLRLKEAAGDGLRGVVYDGAFSGMHLDPLMRAGLLVVSPMKAKSNPDKVRKGPTRVEKSHVLDPVVRRGPGGGCTHDLYAVGGSTHERHVLDDATEHFTPLAYRLKAPVGGPGKRRWYHEVTVPCEVNSDHEVLVPLYITKNDTERGLNRPEYLRQLPPASDDYDRAYGFRPDSESFNCQAEAAFYFHRLPAYGAARQTLVMIGLAMSENAVSRYHHQRRAAAAETRNGVGGSPPGLVLAG